MMCHGKRKFYLLLTAVLFVLSTVVTVIAQTAPAGDAAAPADPVADKLTQAKALLSQANSAFDGIRSYSATIMCQDRIDGKTREREYIFTKFRKPKSVYLKWQPGPYEGMQCSYVPERDGKNQFKALETGMRGMLGIMSWDHDSSIIAALYPHHFQAWQTNIKFLIDLTNDIFKRAEKIGKCEILEVVDVVDPFIKRKATKIVARLSNNKADNLRWPKVEMYFDHQTRLPLHFKLYAFDGGLFGEYAFLKFKTNIAVTDADFEIVND